MQSRFVLYILLSMHCTVANMHAKLQNHQQKRKGKITLAFKIKSFSTATADNLFIKLNLCLVTCTKENTKYSVSEKSVPCLCKHFSLTITLLTLTFSVYAGTPGNYAPVIACFPVTLVQCCPWNLVSSLESYRKLSCNKQN